MLIQIGGATENQSDFTIFDIVGQQYSDSVDALTYDNPNPDKEIQSHKHVRGWIDIVGYTNVTCISNIDCTDAVSPMVEYDVWGDGFGWNDNLDWVQVTDTRITTFEGVTIAEIDVHLRWHHSTLRTRTVNKPTGTKTIKWIDKDYYDEYITLKDTEIAPSQFSINCSKTSVDVVIYNNSQTPKTVFIVRDIPQNTLKISYSYDGETIDHYLGVGGVEQTSKYVSYLNITPCDMWLGGVGDGGILSRMGDTVCLNTSDFEPDKLNISVCDPYGHHDISNMTISVVEWQGSGDTFSPQFWGFVVLVSILLLGTLKQLRRVIK
ncbi:MAG: hypothetical protein JXA38_02710 [Methanosarcinaceae archaeon]|nr:hypothetical protein [Methanosarcinaceae archaeon]